MHASEDDIRKFITGNSVKIAESIKPSVGADEKIRRMVEIFDNIFDVEWMARWAIGGKNWKEMNDMDKKAYLEGYRKYMIKSYLPELQKHSMATFQILSIKELAHNYYNVKVKMVNDKGESQMVTYRCKELPEKIIIRDVIFENNISFIMTQQAEFNEIITSSGKISELISRLNK